MSLMARWREKAAAVLSAAPAHAAEPALPDLPTVARVATVSVATPGKVGNLERFNLPDAALPPDPDRWNWPASPAMNRAELDRMAQRLALFDGRGLSVPEAEALADKLALRDREGDRRGACAECRRLAGYGATGWRCTDHRATPGNELAGLPLAREWVHGLHWCPALAWC